MKLTDYQVKMQIMDWNNEIKFQESVLANPDLSDEQRLYAENRIGAARRRIDLLSFYHDDDVVDIWQYRSGETVRVVCKDGQVYTGWIVAIWDSGELAEEYEDGEDEINIQVDKYTIIGFRPSEIARIERVDEKEEKA